MFQASPPLSASAADAQDLFTARFVDDQVLAATLLVNVNRKQDYNQVVLVGDGFDTRPFRLAWPPGTVIYMVAPGGWRRYVKLFCMASSSRQPPLIDSQPCPRNCDSACL